METNKTHHDAALREALRRLDEWEERGMTNDESGGMTNDESGGMTNDESGGITNDESRFARNDESKSPSNPEGNSYSSSITRHSSFITRHSSSIIRHSSSIIRHSPSMERPCGPSASSKKIAAIFIAAAFLGGLAWALVPRLRSHHTAEPTELSAPSLTGRAGGESALVRFADIRLDSILAVVGRHYGRKVCFRDTLACGLRLHTTWNRTEPLDSLVVTLNEFEVLKLTDERDTLFVESVAKEVEL